MQNRLRSTRGLLVVVSAVSVLFLLLVGSALAAVSPEEESILKYADEQKQAILDDWVELVQIPAPSTKEEARTKWVKDYMSDLGLDSVAVDGIGNVIGVWKGNPAGPTVAFAAHMDTVHPMETDLTPLIKDGRLYAPGSGDNTSSVISLLYTIKALKAAGVQPEATLVFVATVQEEIGLNGADYFLANTDLPVSMFIAVDGGFGGVTYGALGIQWWNIKYKVPAAHTLSSKGKPNAAVALSKLIQRIYTIEVPEEPMAVYNVGTISGGKVTNAVCDIAELNVDLRSMSAAELSKLVNSVLGHAYQVAAETGADIELERTTNIAAGMLPDAENHVLTQTAAAVIEDLGSKPRMSSMGATDANVAIARGIPAVAIGTAKGSRGHSIEESADIESIYTGIKQLLLLALRLK